MELYSKEELLKELKKEYSCGGECDHCPEVLDAGSCSVLRCIRRIIDNASTISIDWGIDDGDRTVYARPQGEWICHSDSYITFYTCNRCNGFGYKDDKFCNNCGARMQKGGAKND